MGMPHAIDSNNVHYCRPTEKGFTEIDRAFFSFTILLR